MKIHHGILAAYICLLMAAAVPEKAVLLAFSFTRKLAWSILEPLTIQPGLAVFYRPIKEDWKVLGQCIQVKSYLLNGTVKKLYETEKSCRPPKVRFLSDLEENLVFRFLEEAILERRPALFQGGDAEKITPRQKAILQTLGDYFCHSNLPGQSEPQVDSVALGWYQRRIEYKTGQKVNPLIFLFKWRCDRQEIAFSGWSPNINRTLSDDFEKDLPWPN